MKFRYLLLALLSLQCFVSFGQITIAADGLNNSSSLFSITGGAYYTGNTGPIGAEVPAVSPYAVEGTHGFGVTNGTATLTSSSVNTSAYSGIYATFRLVSFSVTSTGNGADGTDIVTVEVSPDGGTTYYSTVRVLGNSNATWSYAAGTGIATTPYDGNVTPVDFVPVGGGARTTDGYSTVTITNLPAVTNLRVRITMLNNATAERWVIDDFKIQSPCTAPTTQASAFTSSAVSNFSGTANWTRGTGTAGVIVVARQGGAVNADPASGTSYTANATFGSGTQIGTGNYVVYNGTGTSVSVTGLLENTAYHFAIYEYNTTDTCYHLTELTGNFTTTQCSPTVQATVFTNPALAATTATVGWTRGNGNNVLVVARSGSAVNADPVTGTTYTANSIFGSGSQIGTGNWVVYNGPLTSVAITGLTASTIYHFAIYEYNTASTCYHLTELVGNITTPAAVPAIVLADIPTQVTAASVPQATVNHVLYKFQLSVTTANATFTNLNVTTNGTYISADVSNLRLRYSTDNVLDIADATLGTIVTPNIAGSKSFAAFSQVITAGSTGYFFVTVDVSATAVIGNTIAINALNTGNIAFSSGTKSGSATAGGTQTFSASAPNIPATFVRGCATNTTQILSWTAPATGTYDGFLLVVREAAAPHAVTSIVAASQPFNLNYTLAPTFGGSAIFSRVLYVGTGSTATITGLTAGVSYTYEICAYKNNGASTVYSTPRSITQVAGLSNVTSAIASPGNSSASVTWANPGAICYDQILVVVTAAAGLTFAPSGDGTAYTANSVFSAFNQVVYKGSGNIVNITGLTNGVTYYVEIYVRNGLQWSSGVEVSVTPINVVPTDFKTGDLMLIAYNNNLASGDDGIRIVTLVDVNPGTKFIWTNSTYETGGLPAANVRTDKWFECRFDVTPTGNVPFIEFTYTGATLIPAGSIFCINTSNTSTATTISAVSSSGTTFSSFTVVGKSADGTILSPNHSAVNVSTSNPDSMFLMQGYFIYDPAGSTFVGTLLSGVQDGALWYDLTDDLRFISGANLRRSRKHPQLLCASMQANTSPGTYQRSYDTSVSTNVINNKPTITSRILNFTTNWLNTYAASCPSPSPFTITASDPFNKWNGSLNTNWFDCNNWDLKSVPDETVDVKIDATAARDAIIDYTAAYSDWFLDIAECKDLTISGRKVQLEANPLNKLEVRGNLLIDTTGSLDMDDGSAVTADGNLYLFGNYTNSLGVGSFLEGNGTTTFNGSSPQIINSNNHSSTEQFYNVILENDFTTANSNNLFAFGNLDVRTNKILTVSTNDYAVAGNSLIHNGDISIRNNGQLIQINETDSNSGVYTGTKFQVERIAQARHLDYVYWSAPTDNTTITAIPGNFKYEWGTLTVNPNATLGFWIAPISATMEKAKGYIARASNGSSSAIALPINFTGKPFNGQFTYPIYRGGYSGLAYNDNWNLVGNPYPSAIDADEFLNANNTKIEQTVWIWKHGLLPSGIASPYYSTYLYNYDSNDYIKYNRLGPSDPIGFNGKIASGQGFMVSQLESETTPSTITFNNDMRLGASNAIFNNSQFYRMAQPTNVNFQQEEKHRIWFDMFNEANGKLDRTLLGYATNATNGHDRPYDAITFPDSVIAFYSVIEEKPYTIQGRALPFDINDIVPMGINILVAGSHKIAINAVDGMFLDNSIPIYIEDKYLNIIHDLTQSPYTFNSEVGKFENRFNIRYTDRALSNPEFENSNNVLVSVNKGIVSLNSTNQQMQNVSVYDILGRELFVKNNIDSKTLDISNLSQSKQAIVIKIMLENGVVVSRKVVL